MKNFLKRLKLRKSKQNNEKEKEKQNEPVIALEKPTVLPKPLETKKSKKVVVIAMVGLIVVAGIGFLLYHSNSTEKTENFQKQQEHDRLVAEKENQQLEDDKKQLESAIASSQNRITGLQKQMKANHETFLSNQLQFKEMFSEQKESFDTHQSSMEDSQNINSAFLLKEEVDDRKSKMVELGKTLQENNVKLQNELQEASKEYQTVVGVYTRSFGSNPKYPPITGNNNANEMVETTNEMQRARKDFGRTTYQDPDEASIMRDGNGRAQVPL